MSELEPCELPGCGGIAAPRSPVCVTHLEALPSAVRIAYVEALESALAAPNVQLAVRDARARVVLALLGAGR